MARGSLRLALCEITARARRAEGRGDQTDELGGRILAARRVGSNHRPAVSFQQLNELGVDGLMNACLAPMEG